MIELKQRHTGFPGAKYYVMFFALLIMTSLFAHDAPDRLTPEEQAYLKNKKVLNTSVEKYLKPYSYVENGKPAGYFYDLQKLVAKKLGLELNVQVLDFDQSIQLLKNNQLDVKFYGPMNDEELLKGSLSTLRL